MSWSDVFFDNPTRRHKVVRLCTKLYTLLESNFKRTNEFADIIHKNIPGETFSKIQLDSDKSLKENSQILVKRLDEINRYLEERLEKLGEKMDPAIFKQLTSPSTKFAERLEYARKASAAAIKVAGSKAGLVLLTQIKQGTLLVTLSARLGTLATCCLATVAIGVLCIGADMLISAILGAIEKQKLEKAIMDLEATMDKFEPASDEFNRTIDRLIIRIEDQIAIC